MPFGQVGASQLQRAGGPQLVPGGVPEMMLASRRAAVKATPSRVRLGSTGSFGLDALEPGEFCVSGGAAGSPNPQEDRGAGDARVIQDVLAGPVTWFDLEARVLLRMEE